MNRSTYLFIPGEPFTFISNADILALKWLGPAHVVQIPLNAWGSAVRDRRGYVRCGSAHAPCQGPRGRTAGPVVRAIKKLRRIRAEQALIRQHLTRG